MDASRSALIGRCLCGAVRLTVAGGHDARIGACHCRMCQRWTGGLFLCFAAPAAGVQVTGPVARHASSPFAERAFCATCGSHLWFRDTGSDTGSDTLELMPGLFDEPRDWPLRSEIYTDRAMACLRLEGGHPRQTRAAYEAENPSLQGDDP